MLFIREYDSNHNYRELSNSQQVFHEALKYVLRGETRFHVHNQDGMDFDLLYLENDAMTKADAHFPDSEFYRDELFFPPYFSYDEEDTERINLDLLEGFDEIFFEEANEYTAVIARIVMAHTDLKVSFRDEKVKYFGWLAKKAEIANSPGDGRVLYVQKQFHPDYLTRDRHCTLGLFHSMFLLQWITDLPRKDIKYLEMTIRKTEGIGSLLSTYSKVAQAFDRLGIQVYLAPGCTRYNDQMLSRYFRLDMAPEDANEANTAYVKCFNAFILNHFIDRNEAVFNLSLLQSAFLAELREYADQVLAGRKVLGVLLRGTDYVIANFAGRYRPVPVQDCVSIIRDRMERYGYDCIFLATEDQGYLEQMLIEFPRQIIAVSQERYTVSDFGKDKYISDLEKREKSGSAYDAAVEDTTVNYLYAVYMLSRCESLLANSMCNGVNIAVAFNEGKYVRTEIISELM